jgi:hypothetical protein
MAELSDDIRALVQGRIRPVTFEEIAGAHRPRPRRRRTVARVVSLAVVLGVAVPVIAAVSSAHSTTAQKTRGTAKHRVLAALNATISSGSFNMTFSDEPLVAATSASTSTSSTSPCSSTTLPAPGWHSCSSFAGVPSNGLAITGQGTIDTDPFAMVAASRVPGLGLVTARADGTDVWETGGGHYGLSPGSDQSGPGAPLAGFANLVEGTLGPRQGALGMMGLANPTGYLELDQNAITSADQVSTGTVDGVPVTNYLVSLDPADQASIPGTTPAEAAAIDDALAVLQTQGYTGTKITVSIDAAGYIRQTVSVASFSDGATQTSETTFSDFGCAGKVVMPGQQGSPSPPPGCVSPDSVTTTS